MSTPGARPAFFPGSEPALEGALLDYLNWLAAACDPAQGEVTGLRALLLGGGYGRGEGGIFRDPMTGKTRLYNDLEFYLFAQGTGEGVIGQWAREGEHRLGIEMEFKVLKPSAFEAAKPSMFYYDLLNGNRLVAGEESWVNSLPAVLSRADAIPLVEAPRLLVNRGMSLLRCLRWSRGEMQLPAGFCDRIVSKLRLALADAVLCAERQYFWSVRGRHERLASLRETPPNWQQLIEWHAQGVRFKFHPEHRKIEPGAWREELLELCGAWSRVFLWVESRRLGKEFSSPDAYIAHRGRLFPEEPVWENLARQLRDLRGGPHPRFCMGDHPRSAIWKALLTLLSGPDTAETRRRAARLIGCRSSSGAEPGEFLRACWKKYP